jgi:hypothetical protein
VIGTIADVALVFRSWILLQKKTLPEVAGILTLLSAL